MLVLFSLEATMLAKWIPQPWNQAAIHFSSWELLSQHNDEFHPVVLFNSSPHPCSRKLGKNMFLF